MGDGPHVDLTTDSQSSRAPDAAFMDTLIPPMEPDMHPQQLQITLNALETLLDNKSAEHIMQMQRTIEILQNWNAIIPLDKFSVGVKRVVKEDIAKLEQIHNSVSHLHACARSCLSDQDRLGAIKEVSIISACNLAKVLECYQSNKDLIEPLIADIDDSVDDKIE